MSRTSQFCVGVGGWEAGGFACIRAGSRHLKDRKVLEAAEALLLLYPLAPVCHSLSSLKWSEGSCEHLSHVLPLPHPHPSG